MKNVKIALNMILEYMRMTKKKPSDRDMNGIPKNRAKTWDIKKSRDARKDRRNAKKSLREAPQTFFVEMTR